MGAAEATSWVQLAILTLTILGAAYGLGTKVSGLQNELKLNRIDLAMLFEHFGLQQPSQVLNRRSHAAKSKILGLMVLGLLLVGTAHAQNAPFIEVSCPPGALPIAGWSGVDPSNGNVIQNACLGSDGRALLLTIDSNGIGYSTAYVGATLDIRLRQCINDAMLLQHGNTSGICDARGESGSQTLAQEIDVGDHAQDAVQLLLPKKGSWTVNGISDGVSCGVKVFNNGQLTGPGNAGSSKFAFNAGPATNNMDSVVCTESSPAGGGQYVKMSGFQVTTPGTQATGATLVNGAFNVHDLFDNSNFSDITIEAQYGVGAYIHSACCGTSFYNLTVNGNSQAGAQPIKVGNTGEGTSGLAFYSLSATHAGSGLNEVLVQGSSTWTTAIQFHDLYLEGPLGTADTTTAAVADTAGSAGTGVGGGISFDGIKLGSDVGGSTRYMLDIAGGAGPVFAKNLESSSGNLVNNHQTGQLVQAQANQVIEDYSYNPIQGSTQIDITALPCETSFGITALSTGAATTDTGLSCLPNNAIIDSVVYRVTTTITTATSFTIGDATIATRFCGTQSTMTAGATGVCFAQADQTGTSGPRQTAASKVRITANATPGAGAIRLIVYYHTWTGPTN